MVDDFISSEENDGNTFESITMAFKKHKDNVTLSQKERVALATFADALSTVHTNENIVDKNVAKIVHEVNKHSHKKSCRKYDTHCRFQFPKFPSIKTIIAGPQRRVTDKEKRDKLNKYGKIWRE